MVYSKRLRVVGAWDLFISLVFLIILCFIYFYVDELSIKNKWLFNFFLKISIIVLVILFVSFIIRGIGLIIVGGEWKVLLTDEFISWHVPKNSSFLFFKSDDNFYIKLSELNRVVVDEKKNIGSDDISSTRLVFVTNNSMKYSVTKESGVSFEKILKELHKRGVIIDT